MSRASNFADRIERTVTGPMWHGPALTDLLDGVTHSRAAAHPIAGAHSIWDIVLHISAWARIAKRRMGGEPVEPTADQDWPPVDDETAEAWTRAVEQLATSH